MTTLPYEKARMARKRSQRIYECRLRRSGLYGLKDEQRERIVALARAGGQMAGPLTMHDVDEWAAEVHYRSPWMGKLTTHLMRHMRYRVAAGKFGLSLMPLLIVGDTGNGKTTYAQMLGEVAGAPVREVDVGSGSSAFRIAGLEKEWASAGEGVPIETVLMHRIANPVIVVNEVDKAGEKVSSRSGGVTSLTTALLQVLEPETAGRFECPVHRVRFDLSRFNWVLTANHLSAVPRPLRDRCHIFHMPLVTPDVAAQMFDTLLRDFDADIDDDVCRAVRAAVIEAAEHGHVSLRQIRRILERIAAAGPQILH
ncbi:AAA family ATPase [Marivita sp.]|uniref:AAA family ATPase n=1 Tax=Marivita sp. TaxID=2003365 RepID=UPI003A87E050